MIRKIINLYTNFFQILTKNDIFIYQMGKVGSTSINAALIRNGVGVKQIHCYKLFNMYNLNEPRLINVLFHKISSHLYKLAFFLRKKNMKIITLMRDPVARNLSAEFHELDTILNKYFKEDASRRYNSIEKCILESMNLYVNKAMPFSWFKDELEYFTNVNIFDYSFDKNNGYSIYEKGKYKILVLTCEKLKDNVNVIKDFVGLNELELINQNVGKNKWYSFIYNEFRRNYSISMDDCETYYNNDIVKFFYNQDTILSFKQNWTRFK